MKTIQIMECVVVLNDSGKKVWEIRKYPAKDVIKCITICAGVPNTQHLPVGSIYRCEIKVPWWYGLKWRTYESFKRMQKINNHRLQKLWKRSKS